MIVVAARQMSEIETRNVRLGHNTWSDGSSNLKKPPVLISALVLRVSNRIGIIERSNVLFLCFARKAT